MGCLIDLGECHMSFTLNGEVLIGDGGSEVAFRDFEVADGEGGARTGGPRGGLGVLRPPLGTSRGWGRSGGLSLGWERGTLCSLG